MAQRVLVGACLLISIVGSLTVGPPPYLPESAILAGSYSAPFDGLSGTFLQYFSFGTFSWRQDVSVNGVNSTVLFTDENFYVFSTERDSACSVYSSFQYPLSPLALAAFTYLGSELINYTAILDHWAGILIAPGRTGRPDLPLYVSAYFDPASMQPARWITYASLPDHSSEVYNYDIWDFSEPPSSIFQVPKICNSAATNVPLP